MSTLGFLHGRGRLEGVVVTSSLLPLRHTPLITSVVEHLGEDRVFLCVVGPFHLSGFGEEGALAFWPRDCRCGLGGGT